MKGSAGRDVLALKALGILVLLLKLVLSGIWGGYNVVRVRILGALMEWLPPHIMS